MSDFNVGFVGLGLMGSGFTERLVEKGYSVFGYDRKPEKVEAAKKQGVKATENPADIARHATQIHVCVMTPNDLEEVIFSKEGLCGNPGIAEILVDHSTTPVDVTKDFAQRLNKKTGIQWIDAPVSGGPSAAREGTLAIMAGATEQTFERAIPILQHLGECTRMGDVGAGQVTKMVNQILVLNNYCVQAEALAMAEAGGVDPEKIPAALARGHAGSNLLQHLFPRMIKRDFEPAGYAFQILKDLQMVGDLAKSLDVETPMSAQATMLFSKLNDAGNGKLDGTSIMKLYKGELGIPDTGEDSQSVEIFSQ